VDALKFIVIFISLIITTALLGIFAAITTYLPQQPTVSPSGENNDILNVALDHSVSAGIIRIPTLMMMPDPLPYSGVSIGFYQTRAGISLFPHADFWHSAGKSAAGKFPGSNTGAILAVGIAREAGKCFLSFPSLKKYSDILFSTIDENEEYLDYYDSAGIPVILQVEPGNANVSRLITLVLDQYARHPCVAGVGIDVELYKWTTNEEGKPVTDQEAAQWYDCVRSYNKDYMLGLTHWDASKMPPTYRTGLYFLYDGQAYGSLNVMKKYYTSWGNSFPNNPVGIYIGFQSDKSWWSEYSDPFYTLATTALACAKNTRGVYWVSYSVKDIYPVNTAIGVEATGWLP
jgi:hypothetical protein